MKTPKPGWREAILERDCYECQLSRQFGISQLTGVPCSEELQVHHKTYERYGEELLEDGISICTRCHDIITDAVRRIRYAARNATPKRDKNVQMVTPKPKERIEDEEVEFHNLRRSSAADAQREIGGFTGPLQHQDERDHQQEEEDRRRSRGTSKVGVPRRIVPK